MEPSAQIKMCVQMVAQFVFHECNNVKCPFIFNWSNNLDNNNFDQLYVFQEVKVEDNKCGDFTAKPHKGIEMVLFMQCYFRIMQHGHLEMTKM